MSSLQLACLERKLFFSFRDNDALGVLLFGQVVIGIGTVLHAAPLSLAILHQLGAVTLWVLILRARFLSQYPVSQNLRSSR